MKNNKLFVFISFAVIPLFSLAQTKETFFDKYQNSIFFAPMNVLDYINPSLQTIQIGKYGQRQVKMHADK